MKTLLFFAQTRLEDMLNKGNVWYVRNYEAYFDRVYVVYLSGGPHEPVLNGNTTLVSLGTGNGLLNLLLSPFRLYRFAKKIKPTSYLTADKVFSWWTSLIIKLLLRAKIVLMPICMPEQIYKSSGRTLTGFLPIWLERLLIKLSFLSSNRVLTGESFGSFVTWLKNNPLSQHKLVVVNPLVEALPSQAFFDNLQNMACSECSHSKNDETFRLIYVGRLHREKLVSDLIKMLAFVRSDAQVGKEVTLQLVGDGPDKAMLVQLARDMGVSEQVQFVGAISNDHLPQYLAQADAFVSPLTGTSLREAALCGLPIVAYDMDWISGLLKHEQTALLIAAGDYQEMARQVMRLINDAALRERLSHNIKELAWKLWAPIGCKESLQQAFEAI